MAIDKSIKQRHNECRVSHGFVHRVAGMPRDFKTIRCREGDAAIGTSPAIKLAGWWFGTFFPYIGNNHPN